MRRLGVAVTSAVIAGAVIVPGAGTAGAGHRVDLSTGEFDGHSLLGRTPAGVRALLGRPDATSGNGRPLYRA